MGDTQSFKAATIYDFLGTLQGGANSGVAPLLLEKSQASYLNNITVRDGFATPRPPYSRTHLAIAWPSPMVQTEVEQGLFQGAMPIPYRSDSGETSQIAQISGKLYKFLTVGNVITVSDISIPGDPNPATATQAWLWQSENFIIVQDGLSLPIFYDGATSRRSLGTSQQLAVTAGVSPTIPAIGGQFTLNLASTFTGQFNFPVIIGGFFYQPIANPAGYEVNLTNITDTPGTLYPIGTQVVSRADVFGVLNSTYPIGNAPGTFAPNGITIVLTLTLNFTGAVGDTAIILGKIWRVTTFTNQFVQLTNNQTVTIASSDSIPAGTLIPKGSSSAPNVVIGSATVAFTSPAGNAVVQVTLDNVYSGTSGAQVFIGDRQYTIAPVPPPPPSGTTLTVINLNAPSGGTILNSISIMSVPELPAGRMGAYGHGQNWVSLVDGVSFLPSDISGAPSGTPAYQYRDAVLKTTEFNFRSGNFRIPSAGDTITSMTFAALLDTSMGQGPLMIGTARSIFSCIAPVNAENLAAIILRGSPVQTESLKGRGPIAQNSTINVNSDIQFRSTVGLGSLIIARQQFTSSLSGNTPISEEMVRVFKKDNQQLLPYGSAINFDNRVLFTASPQASSQGVFHTSLVAMNLDGLSSLRGKEPAVYDGQWTGLNVLQLTQGLFNGTSRAFAFTFNVTLSKIELYELFQTATEFVNARGELTLANYYDNGTTPITAIIESATLFGLDVKPNEVFLQLLNGEMAVDSIVGTVRFQIFYKPDQFGAYGESSCWLPWADFTVCAKADSKPLYYPRLGFGEPSSESCIPQLDIPARYGRTFQVRILASGMWRMLSLRVAAVTQPVPQFQPPLCNVGGQA